MTRKASIIDIAEEVTRRAAALPEWNSRMETFGTRPATKVSHKEVGFLPAYSMSSAKVLILRHVIISAGEFAGFFDEMDVSVRYAAHKPEDKPKAICFTMTTSNSEQPEERKTKTFDALGMLTEGIELPYHPLTPLSDAFRLLREREAHHWENRGKVIAHEVPVSHGCAAHTLFFSSIIRHLNELCHQQGGPNTLIREIYDDPPNTGRIEVLADKAIWLVETLGLDRKTMENDGITFPKASRAR